MATRAQVATIVNRGMVRAELSPEAVAAIVDAVMLIADEVVAANAAVTALQAAPVVLSAVYPSMPAGLVAKAGTGVTITIGAPTLGDIEFKV